MRIAITGTRGTLGMALSRQAEEAGHVLFHLNRPESGPPEATPDAW